MSNILEDENIIAERFVQLLNNDNACWIGRIGGSDYSKVFEFLDKFSIDNNNLHIKFLNGYFDKSTSVNEQKYNFIKFVVDIIESYKTMDLVSVATIGFINYLIKDKKRIDVLPVKTIFNYSFIEGIYPFLNSFKIWGKNKKILIVSPFSKSIQYQIHPDRINNLIKNYTFPNCEFITYQSLITYNAPFYDNTLVNKQTSGYNNFNEYVEKMCDDIHNIDLDMAFLSCGSYALKIGNFIKNKMNKKAIYIGGCLNILFNIYGERYHTQGVYGREINNMQYNIKSLEQNEILDENNIRKLEQLNIKSEGFKAYFSL